jgi:diketogulonate reductase-like aldo/keto reductase
MAVDPTRVPFRTLKSGRTLPAIGLGTFGSDKYSAHQVADAVSGALEVGYRHIDCAAVYGNEAEIGKALAASQVPREELWITSKVWNDRHEDVVGACEKSLADLQVDYLDLYLVHWPFPNHHGPGVGVDARDPHAVPFQLDRFMATWKQMEALVERGLVKEIGTSNMTISKLQGVLDVASIPPAANELELHPHFQQPALFEFLQSSGILPIGYSPIGSPSRPDRDRTPTDTVDTTDPVIARIAHRLGVHPAIVCVLWQIEQGSVPIPFSVKREQFEPMIDAVASLHLTNKDMDAITELDRDCRLIKGQVFLWKDAQDWRDLWD